MGSLLGVGTSVFVPNMPGIGYDKKKFFNERRSLNLGQC